MTVDEWMEAAWAEMPEPTPGQVERTRRTRIVYAEMAYAMEAVKQSRNPATGGPRKG